MESERKGNNIFLGVVGVATLIVAIIGASFAYFNIQTSSEEGAVNVTSFSFSAALSMSEIYGPGEEGIIPVDPNGEVDGATAPDNTNLAYAINVESGAKTRSCRDRNGHGICALYEVTITNDNSEPLTLNGVIRTVENTPGNGGAAFANLKYRLVTKSGDYYTIGNTATTLGVNVDDEASLGQIVVPAKQGASAGTYTTYILVYLDETGDDQSGEMGANFSGQVVFTSEETEHHLTGTFNVT